MGKKRGGGYATRMGIMGAIAGGLSFKLREWETERARQAEIEKERRLEQILMEREARAEQRDIRTDERRYDQRLGEMSVQADIQRERDKSSQDHEVALTGLRHEYSMQEQGGQNAAAMERVREQNRAEIERTRIAAQQRSEGRGPQVLGTDGNWYDSSQPLPQGVRPVGGAGMSWAPSESKSVVPGQRPGAPGAPAQKPWTPPSGVTITPLTN